jgi:type IX secretion system substrate protein
MKKIFPALLFLIASTGLYAQISINSDDMPKADDKIRLSQAADVSSFDLGMTGEDYNWDFSTLHHLSQSVDTFVSSSETPFFYQLIFLNDANMASPLGGIAVIPELAVSQVFQFYNKDDADFRDLGYAFTFSGLPLSIKYDQADILFKFPLEYADEDSVFSSYGQDFLSLAYVGGWKKRISKVDGWGMLTTPYGSFETLRLKCDVTQYDSLYIDSLGMGMPILRNYTEYKWIGKDQGLPLLKIIEEAGIVTASYIDSLRPDPFFISDVQANIENLNVFPNPASSVVNLHFELLERTSIEIHLLDLDGKGIEILYSSELSKGFQELMLKLPENLASAVYFLKITDEQGATCRKILVH